MSRSLRARMILMLTGNVSRQSKKYGDDLEGMGKRGERGLTRLQRRAREVEDGMGRMARRAGALAGAFIGMQEVRRVMSLEERLERLGVNTGRSTKEMQALRASINEVAAADDIRVDPGEIIAGIESIAEATGDMDMAEALKREIALAIQATGSGGAEIGKLIASISSKFDIKTADGMLAALDLLAKQGKAGAIELRNLADLGPKVFSAYASVGKQGVAGLAEAGALMQIFKQGVGGPDQAATVFENVFNALSDVTKLKQLAKAGVQVRDAAGDIVEPLELIKNAVRAAGGDDLKLGMIFDAEAMRGIRQISKMYRDKGNFDDLEVIISLKADGKTIEADAERMAQTANASVSSALTGIRSVTEEKFAEPVQQLAEALRGVDAETVERWGKIGLALAGIAASIKLAKGTANLVRDVRSLGEKFGSKGDSPGPEDKLGPVDDVIRVFVTNPGFAGNPKGKDGADGKGKDGAEGKDAPTDKGAKTTDGPETKKKKSRRTTPAAFGIGAALVGLSNMRAEASERTAQEVERTGDDPEIVRPRIVREVVEEYRGYLAEQPVSRDILDALGMGGEQPALTIKVVPEFTRSVEPKTQSRNRDIPKPPNPVRERVIERIIGGREDGPMSRAGGGGFADPLTGGYSTPQGPLNPLLTPQENSPELLDAMRDVVDGNSDILTEMRDMNRALRRSRSPAPMSAGGDPYRMMGTGR